MDSTINKSRQSDAANLKLQAKGSELSAEERRKVAAFEPAVEDISNARKSLAQNAAMVKPNQDDIIVAAKIIGALPDERIPKDINGEGVHKLWLLTESYILQGKDTGPLHQSSLDNIVNDARENMQLVDILQNTAPNAPVDSTLAPIEKPENAENDPEVMKKYRTDLVNRHLRACLAMKEDGLFYHIQMSNLYETLMRTIDLSKTDIKEMQPLYDTIEKNISSNAQVDGWFSRVSKADLQMIANVVAESDFVIHEKTAKEQYLHGSGGQPDYVAKDATLEAKMS